ncbi:MAG TPA: hypothetical protein VFB84_04455 [Micromonosporaceae bacterium]|nr:hypothetical protein [Micromonosporaceae bacterium]
MPHPLRRTVLAAVSAAAILASPTGAPALAGPGHPGLVAGLPPATTPDIVDGHVRGIFDAGAKVVAVGTFTQVRNRDSAVSLPRRYVLAFSKADGRVDTVFAPVVDGVVNAVIAGPAPGTVYLAGRFNSVNGVTRRKLALVNVADGTVVTSFAPPVINGGVNDMAVVGGRLLLGGVFTRIAGQPRNGLAAVSAVTGALDSYLGDIALTEHHNWTEGSTGAKAGVGADKLAASPDGTQLVVIGNFKRANGVLHDQVLKIDLGATAATVANWNTDDYQPRCRAQAFDSWVRDLAFSPDGAYFVIVTTGAPYAGTLCDTAARWEAAATGANASPTWVDYSGGDTLLSVAVTEQAVYVGGHIRFMNNTRGTGGATAGAVGRPSLAALDPLSGVPLAWNPGRHPRGYGVSDLYATAEGLWVGHDTDWMGNHQYRRERIAFLPLAGGYTPHPSTVATLPGRVYQAGGVTGAPVNGIFVRGYDGASSAASLAPVANPDGTPWGATRGAFWVGGTLFYGLNGALYRRTFGGTAFGPPTLVDPYHDPYWDYVVTDSGPTGQTYRGVTTGYYAELANVTGACYVNGRLYYTLNGQSGLFWRWFSPDSGVLGDRFQVPGVTGFADSGGIFVAGGRLYRASRSTGTLSRMSFVNGVPTGTATVVSGPGLDGQDWRGRGVFISP